MSKVKYKIIKSWISFRKRMDSYMRKEPKLDKIQSKAIELYNLYLNDKESYLSCSLISKKRHIERDGVLMILTPIFNDKTTLTVIDENEKNLINCYEVKIPDLTSSYMENDFDLEMERRLKGAEFSKKEAISKDLDKLIKIMKSDD